jgi:hypothetical protein
MRRSFIGLATAAAVAVVSGVAQAGTFVPGESSFTLRVGSTYPI